MTLNKQQILEADDLPRELVPVPEWGGDILVRSMSGAEKDSLDASLMSDDGTRVSKERFRNYRARVAVLTVVGEDGDLLFTEADIAELTTKSARALDRVFEVAARLNGITGRDMDDIAKNSEPTPDDGDSGK